MLSISFFLSYITPNLIRSVIKAPFHLKVHETLRKWRYEKPKPVQAYSWPAVMRRLNVCIVNGPKTGKTMSYIPPLVSFMIEKEERYQHLPPEIGPIIIVVCSDCYVAEHNFEIFYEMCLNMKKDIKIQIVTPPLDARKMVSFG